MSSIYPEEYLRYNSESSKQLNVVVAIEGVSDFISSGNVFTKVRYGDPGIAYGDPGLVYGGLRPLTNFKPYLNLDGSMTISQKIEPEQGRGAISLLTLSFTDKDGYFTKLISPGQVVDEPLGNKQVKIYLGYRNTSFPEDYFIVLRAYISQTTYSPSKVTIQLSDPNIKRKAQSFFTPTTKLTGNIDAVTLSIPVAKTDGFYQQIQDIDGNYDTSVKTYIKIDDEFMEYGPTGLSPTVVTVSSRGARNTTAASHTINTDVTNAIQLQGNVVDLALKLMLSGWNGPFLKDIGARSIANTTDPMLGIITNTILLPESTDAVQDLGLIIGDQGTITGSTAGNNGTFKILSIGPALSRNNRLLYTNKTFNVESPASTVLISFRSKYDTLPVPCGTKLKSSEVDIATHLQIRNDFLSQSENTMSFIIDAPTSAKTFIETELMYPIGCYSVTRYGQISMAITKPPIADQKLITLSKDNIKDMPSTTVMRGINNRRYFDEIQYSIDADDSGSFTNIQSRVDDSSLSKITVSSVLPVASKGLKSVLGAQALIDRRSKFMLRRFGNAAIEVKLKTSWETISQLEVSDVVLLKDDGTLHIANLSDGSRNLQSQLFEVTDRSLNMSQGDGQLTLLGGLGFQVTDRFATISPSSELVGSMTTSTRLKLRESFGGAFPGQEFSKWTDFIGLTIHVHDYGYTRESSAVFTGFDPADPFTMLLATPLSFTPSDGDIVEINDYPNTTDPNDDALYKLIFCHIDPSVPVVSGTDNFNFHVSVLNAAKIIVGATILIHNESWAILSPEVKVTFVDYGTGLVTVDTSLGFTPNNTETVELIGFIDGGGPYRIL